MQAVGKEVVAAVEPLHQVAYLARLAPHERTHVVAKPAVPLQPPSAREPAAELVAGDVPCLRHEPDVEQAREQAELHISEASWTFIVPSAAREKIEARLKRDPFTPIVRAQ